MKKNQVDEILSVQAERKKKIFRKSFVIGFFSFIVLCLIVLIFNQNKTYYVKYTENSNVDYKVYLKDNEFYEYNYLDKDNEYVVSLIDYINASFKYELNLEEKNVNYDYIYYIDAELNIRSSDSDNAIFTTKDVLLEEVEVTDYSKKNLDISENVKIDYNKYNDLVRKFVEVYGLDKTESDLIVRLHVSVLDNCIDGKYVEGENEYIVELEIPLNEKTVDIAMSSDVVDLNDNLMICDKNENVVLFLFILIVIIILFIVHLIIKLVRYILDSRTPQTVYDRELKKILNNYKSYIQKINTVVDFNAYKVMKVDTFTDMLEIRDTVQQPILMSEDKYKRGTYFMIPTNTKIMYVYGLKVNDIKKEMKEKLESKHDNSSV